ncbi:MAG TPA: carboxypeptidase-like regulatory domain-containing protein [Sphingomicrobium sp.]|nr:carboxypeptidase-like regulatory domain-containing protein [Sphingomicrobium sp.]
MSGRRTWLRQAGALLSLASLSAFGAVAATPVGDGWAADPETQFLLDVKLHQYRLGDGVRAYNTPEGTCIVFGDFLATLDVPMRIDLTAKTASGWAFKESNRISIDAGSGQVAYGGKSEALAPNAIRETPEGWCVDSASLTRWFGIGVKPFTNGSMLLLETEAKLPVELAIERQKRAENLHKAKFDLASLPQVKLPYRMWRAPALDFVVSAGATYRADNGIEVDRQSSIHAAGEIARLSYDAQIATDQKGIPASLRLRAYRSDPDGELLGPLKATHFGFGDVSGFSTRIAGTATSGRGALVTNRPVASLTDFDRTRFEGDLPAGWDAELYRNGQLLAFAHSDARQRYAFDDVQLLYGENEIKIVLYGPQGQVRSRVELINVGEDNVPPGKTWYWAGFNQPGRDIVALHQDDTPSTQPKMQAAVSMEHGLDERTSVGVIARTMLLEDERVTFVEGSVRRSIGSALIEVAAARETGGGIAARAQLLAKLGKVNLSAEAVAANDFHLRGGRATSVRDGRFSVDAPVSIGRTVVPVHGDIHYVDRADGSSELQAAGRLSTTIGRFNLATAVKYSQQFLASGPDPPPETTAELMGTGRIGAVRVRGASTFQISPESKFRSAELSAYWSASDTADWEAGLAYDGPQHRARARISHIRRFDALALAVTGEAASDGSLAIGFNLNFSLDPGHGFSMSRELLAGAGSVRARVFRDMNDNGREDPGEPVEKGAFVTAGTAVAPKATGEDGSVMIAGLGTYTPIAIGIDRASISDPMFAPRKAIQVVVPRPGVPAEVQIALVGAGDIEGAIVKNGGVGFEGLDLELVDGSGAVIATARTDYDGYFLFQGVPYGSYSVRIAKASAEAVRVAPDLKLDATVSDEQPVDRLGSIQIQPPPRIAFAQ